MKTSDQWDDFAARHRRGERVTAPVYEVVDDIGLFVDLGQNAFGIIHLQDLAWHSPGDQEVNEYSIGDEVHAVILAIDVDRQRISLGLKQLEPEPDRPSGWRRGPPSHPRGPPSTGPDPENLPVGPAPKPSPDAGEMDLTD